MNETLTDENCRLCGSSIEKPLIHIFGVNGLKHRLNEKIYQRLNISVTREDLISKSICCQCCGKLDIYDKFVKEVRETQGILHKEAINKLKNGNRVMKEENLVDTIQIDDDMVGYEPYHYDMTVNNSNQDDNHVSVIKYPFINSTNENSIDETRLLITPKSTEIPFKHNHVNGDLNLNGMDRNRSCAGNDSGMYDGFQNSIKDNRKSSMLRDEISTPKKKIPLEMKQLQSSEKHRNSDLNRNERVLRSSTEVDYYPTRRQTLSNCTNSNSDGTPNEIRLPDRRSLVHKVEKKDFTAQIGNTLHSDIVGLKHSLLLRRVPMNNVAILTLAIPIQANKGNSRKTHMDTTDSKGCQTEIVLCAKSDATIPNTSVYQKISLDGMPYLDMISEKNAVNSSPLLSILP